MMNKKGFMLLTALMSISAGARSVSAGKEASRVHDARQERKMLVERYHAMHQVELERNIAAGKYADLYKLPAWSVGSLFFDDKNQVTVLAKYSYATDCYDSSGGGSQSNITRLAFGEKQIQLQDILLASRLAKRDYPAALTAARAAAAVAAAATSVIQAMQLAAGGAAAGGAAAAAAAAVFDLVKVVGVTENDKFASRSFSQASVHDYLSTTALDRLVLLGRAESYGLNLSFARYAINDNFSIGFDLPVVYKKNTLKADYDFSDKVVLETVKLFSAGSIVGGMTDQFLERYGNNPQRFLKDIMTSKGINELGGSAAGLGDVSLFASGQFSSAQCDKIVTGLRLQLPTGKKQAMDKLWSPDLGNGGFTELSAFGNVVVSYKKCINPHASLSAGLSLPGHVERRIPKKVSVSNGTAAVEMVSDLLAADQRMAFADRISLSDVAGVNAFSEFDSIIPNFGDSVTRVKITRGAELKARFGNMFEQFLSRRAFFDVFYDFRAKMKDGASGPASDVYDIDSVREHTNQLEHRLGFDYTYQLDLASRLHLGTVYTVAGRNVPKTFDISGSFNYAF